VLPSVKQIIYGIDIKRDARQACARHRGRLALGRRLHHLPRDDLKVGLFRQEQLAEPAKA